MTEEEYFRKNYPNSCYGDKPLSPHWDFFQDGVEFGERQSEKRIAELEATNKTISNECHKLVDSLEKKQNEVAELKKQLRDKKCNDKDCPVFIKLIQANKENAELREKYVKECEDVAFVVTNYSKQLTKAKEIIKTLAADLSMYSGDYQKELLEADQFLKLDNDEIYEHIQKAKYNYIN